MDRERRPILDVTVNGGGIGRRAAVADGRRKWATPLV
jgi:hypothetical protein